MVCKAATGPAAIATGPGESNERRRIVVSADVEASADVDRAVHPVVNGAMEGVQARLGPVRTRPGVYVCGDHCDNASINGAMVSGRRAAEAVFSDLSR